MQTYTKHIPKLTYVYITYANIYQTYTKINTCLYNICKHETTKHIPKLTYVYITYANIYQTYTKINICLYNICKHIPNIYQN